MNRLFTKWWFGVLGATLLVSVVWAHAAAATGTVNGSVTWLGDPVVGARVVIDSESDSSYGAVANTDERGLFTFSNAPVGALHVKAYDSNSDLLVSGDGILQRAGEVITLSLQVVR